MLKTKRGFLLLALALVLSWAAPTLAGSGNERQKAMGAARYFLALVDKGNYNKAYRLCDEHFKEMVPKAEFNNSLAAARRPLGKIVSRRLVSRKLVKDPPGKLPGTYYVFQFAAKYREDPKVKETITPMKGEDGRWRVAGYLIH